MMTAIQRIDAVLFRINKREASDWFTVDSLKKTIEDDNLLSDFNVTNEYLYEILEQLSDDGYLKRNTENKSLDVVNSSYYTTSRGKLFQGYAATLEDRRQNDLRLRAVENSNRRLNRWVAFGTVGLLALEIYKYWKS